MTGYENNYAFIDSQNLNLGVASLGWKLDYRAFRVYLKQKYHVTQAFLFLGYIPSHAPLYTSLQRYGYTLVFKQVLHHPDMVKGNIDAELVLHTMIEYVSYDKALIVSSDGDFACLVQYLKEQHKLAWVISPQRATCSILLRKVAQDKIAFLDTLKQKLEYKRKSTA